MANFVSSVSITPVKRLTSVNSVFSVNNFCRVCNVNLLYNIRIWKVQLIRRCPFQRAKYSRKVASVLEWNPVVSPTVCSPTTRVDSPTSYMSVRLRFICLSFKSELLKVLVPCNLKRKHSNKSRSIPSSMSRKTTALKHRSWNVFKNFFMAQPGRLRIECVKDVLLKMI